MRELTDKQIDLMNFALQRIVFPGNLVIINPDIRQAIIEEEMPEVRQLEDLLEEHGLTKRDFQEWFIKKGVQAS